MFVLFSFYCFFFLRSSILSSSGAARRRRRFRACCDLAIHRERSVAGKERDKNRRTVARVTNERRESSFYDERHGRTNCDFGRRIREKRENLNEK